MYNDTTQRAVLSPNNAGAVFVSRECGRAADEPRVERGAVRTHHAHRAGADAGDAPQATRACSRITRFAVHSRTRTAPRSPRSSQNTLFTCSSPLSGPQHRVIIHNYNTYIYPFLNLCRNLITFFFSTGHVSLNGYDSLTGLWGRELRHSARDTEHKRAMKWETLSHGLPCFYRIQCNLGKLFFDNINF